ncbi:MAG: hypothetical protein V1845_03080 [bacterium]
MEKIFYKKKLIGFRVKALPKGSIPLTDGKEPLQVVTLRHKNGAYLKAHMHKPRKRTTDCLQEFLMVKKGRIKLDLYGPDKKFLKFIYLSGGDFFVLMHGGYGIHVLEDAEMVETKNGPFIEDKILI